MKDMKMDKQVKRIQGTRRKSRKLGSKRRERHQEILSEQLKSDVQ